MGRTLKPIPFIDSPEFHEPGASAILADALPPWNPGENPAIETEARHFRAMHYRRFLAASGHPDRERLLTEATSIRNTIIVAAMPLSPFVVGKMLRSRGQFYRDAVADGHAMIVRAADLFDYRQRSRFSTYACRAVRWGVLHMLDGRHERGIGATDAGTAVDVLASSAPGPVEETETSIRATLVRDLLARLPTRERTILAETFGIGCDEMTAAQISDRMSVTTARVFFMRRRALNRLRSIADRAGVSLETV